jgi:excisionase family DNA binding protein
MSGMLLSVKQAAKATGATRPAILRAIESHELSATKDEATQEWRVEASELYRVFPPIAQKPARVKEPSRAAAMDKAALRREIEIREQQLAVLREERERERADKDRQIASLSEQLMAANEERRIILRQLTALLTDRRRAAEPDAAPIDLPKVIPMPPPSTPSEPPVRARSWFRRMMGTH